MKIQCIIIPALLVSLVNTALQAQDARYAFVPPDSNFALVAHNGAYRIVSQASSAEQSFNHALRQAASGSRITDPGDDPAGKAVAEKMESVLREAKQRAVNARDRKSYLAYVDSIIGDITGKVQRIRVLSVQASNGIMGELERDIIQTEIDMIVDSIENDVQFAEFNKKKIELPLTPENLGLETIDVVNAPGQALAQCDRALQELSVLRSQKGAESRMLTMRIKGKQYHFLHLTAAQSGITDANLAEVSTKLSLERVKIQSAYGMLYKVLNKK